MTAALPAPIDNSPMSGDGDIVIGSGPAGVAAASALLGAGRRVTLLDVGEDMEPACADLRSRLRSTDPSGWTAEDIARLTAKRSPAKGKMPFGSDILFRDPVGFFGTAGAPAEFSLRPSFAKGGFSTGWGAAILPYRAQDIDDWPLSLDDLDDHYAALSKFMPVAARRDRLQEVFPIPRIESDTSLTESAQARELLRRLEDHAPSLEAKGIFFGKARQAASNRCYRCGMCLYGCAYDYIFNAAYTVDRLSGSANFRYIPATYVDSVHESAAGTEVAGTNLTTSQRTAFQADRVFIAAGVLQTLRIVSNSIDLTAAELTLKDSQHFFLPMLHSWSASEDPEHEDKHTLTQVFLELIDREVSGRTVHVQLYTYHDWYAEDMRLRFGGLSPAIAPLIRFASKRLIVAQGFLHSDLSSQIKIRVGKGGNAGNLTFEVQRNQASSEVIAKVGRLLSAALPRIGLWPIRMMGRIEPVGSSFHGGATFPMRRRPGRYETDTLGRLPGLTRIHLVDASVLPAIPATTITYSVMANAHRIATQAARI